MDNSICTRLQSIHERMEAACKRAGRNPEELLLVAVSKTKPLSDIESANQCGQLHFGENRAKELQDKMELSDSQDIVWHFVGPMQTNKIKYMVEQVDWIQSVYKKKYFREIEKRASRIDRTIQTTIQVNISREDQKQGCRADELPGLLEYAQNLEHVRVRGLMGMATYTDNPEDVRSEFSRLKEIFDAHQSFNGGSVHLEHLSMGMTNDFEVAIEEGATLVRVGRAIFGERDYTD
ncbi:MAG: YggS family pyridoxal phosphate-dependent enzyme [Balneolaceae bacterium]